jgi:hypothetical protein
MLEDFDLMIERWHVLADLLSDKNPQHFNAQNLALVRQIHDACLIDSHLDEIKSGEEFINYALDLRRNEKAWSRRLGDVMIRAQDFAEANEKMKATSAFDEFVAECPWAQFIEHAKNQRSAMGL